MTTAWEDRWRERATNRIRIERVDVENVTAALAQLSASVARERVVLVFNGFEWSALRDTLERAAKARRINWYRPATSELRALGYEATVHGCLVAADRQLGNALLVYGKA